GKSRYKTQPACMPTSRSRTLKSRYASENRSYLFWGDRPLGKQGLLRADDTDGLYLKQLYLEHLAEAARAGRDAVALYGRSGTPRLAFAPAVALIRHAVPPRDCGT